MDENSDGISVGRDGDYPNLGVALDALSARQVDDGGIELKAGGTISAEGVTFGGEA